MLKNLFRAFAPPEEIAHIPENIGRPGSQIPEVVSELHLQDGEKCALVLPATWYRLKGKTSSMGIHVSKGAHIENNGLKSRDTHLALKDSLKELSDGKVFITSKRVIFEGDKQSTSLLLTDVVDVVFGPDHFRLIKENHPTEIFSVSPRLFNHKKVRLLIARLWKVARVGGNDPLAEEFVGETPSDDQRAGLFISEIEQLVSSLLYDEADSVEADVRKFETLIGRIQQLELGPTPSNSQLKAKVVGPLQILTARILTAQKRGYVASDVAEALLIRVEASATQFFPFLSPLQVFTEKRRNDWPDHSKFDGQEGLAGQALALAYEMQLAQHDTAEDDLAGSLEQFDQNQQMSKQGSAITSLFFDCEALANRHAIYDLDDADVFVYLAAVAVAESFCANCLSDEAWEELAEHVSIMAGPEKVDLIFGFVANLANRIDQSIYQSFCEMEASFQEVLTPRFESPQNPWDFYRKAILAAESFCVEMLLAARNT